LHAPRAIQAELRWPSYPSGQAAGFVHDTAGNLTNDPTGAAARNYAWDAEGRLTTVTDSSGGRTSTSYVYYALGQDVEIETMGAG
jgi:YD repeat-containing protein